MNTKHRVAVLGASSKPERYSNKAVKLLMEHQYSVIPVHPVIREIEGLKVFAGLNQIAEKIDTLTLYIGPAGVKPLIPEIIALNPGRVILNPGTESELLKEELHNAGIPYMEACTLVLLKTGQF